MKISYNWLRDYVKTELSPRELANKLTNVGLAVDSIDPHEADFILDFDLTSNRPDALSHIGMAREAAAVSGVPVEYPSVSIQESEARIEDLASVTIENPELCPRYTARMIRGIKVGPSPAWLVERLAAVGQRSINNVVDVTNFVLLELGHPLHAFDYELLGEHQIVVRTAREGETLTTLDGIERQLTPQMLVIADGEKAVAMAGVMGGANSEIGDETVNVLIESAYFEPAQVRRTSRALDLHTEASHRFERGADCEMPVLALNRCTQLIQEVAGGEIVAGVIDAYPNPPARKSIQLRRSRVRTLSGVDVSAEQVESALNALGFVFETVTEGEVWQVVGPTYRVDINIEADLVEEVIRLVGYAGIPATLPGWGGAGSYLAGETQRRRIRQCLVGQGFSEAISFSWASDADVQVLGADGPLVITNPIDKTEDRMRPILLPGLVKAVAHNFNYGTDNVRLFEIGKVFEGSLDGFQEAEHLALVVTGAPNTRDWSNQARTETFHTLKGILESILAALQIQGAQCVVPEGDLPQAYFPGQTAQVVVDGKAIGWLGRMSVPAMEQFKLKQPVYLCEVTLGALLHRPQTFAPYRPLPKFPSVERDISALVGTDVSYATIEQTVIGLGLPAFKSMTLKEVFTGKQVPSGKRSLTLNLCYRLENRTLTDQEVSAQHAQVLAALQSQLGAEIR